MYLPLASAHSPLFWYAPADTDLNYTAPTVSGSYVQAEVQGIADNLETASDKIDEILTVLSAAGITS